MRHRQGALADVDTTTLVHAPQWGLENATGINDQGVIVGEGTYQGKPHGFLLRPIPQRVAGH